LHCISNACRFPTENSDFYHQSISEFTDTLTQAEIAKDKIPLPSQRLQNSEVVYEKGTNIETGGEPQFIDVDETFKNVKFSFTNDELIEKAKEVVLAKSGCYKPEVCLKFTNSNFLLYFSNFLYSFWLMTFNLCFHLRVRSTKPNSSKSSARSNSILRFPIRTTITLDSPLTLPNPTEFGSCPGPK